MTYPLTIPGWPAPRFARFSVDLQPVSAMSSSVFTKEQQTYQWSGGIWVFKATYPPLTRAQAAPIIAFLRALDGCYRTFLAGDPAAKTPRGSWAGSPAVNGAHAVGATTLNVTGLTPGASIAQGDYMQIQAGTSPLGPKRLFFMCGTADVTADGSGHASIDIRPGLREALLGGESIVTTDPVGTFRMQDNAQAQYECTPGPVCNILGFTAIEAIP